jgi:hypothetical protein
MLDLYKLVLSLHVAAGLTGLAAFWTPAFARKGGTTHVQAGRVFYKATCVIAVTGLAMAALVLLAPLAVHPRAATLTAAQLAAAATQDRLAALFLVYLVIITVAPVHHGVRVLETRGTPEKMRTPFHTALGFAAIAAAAGMIALALVAHQPVFAALSPIGFLVGRSNLRFAREPYASRMAWWYEHMGSMLGGGIAFHTAFLVIGAGRLLGTQLTGFAAVVPWVLPSLIGIPATAIWVGYYRRRFNEDGPAKVGRIVARSA